MLQADWLGKIALFKRLDMKRLAEGLNEREDRDWRALKREIHAYLFGEELPPEVEDRRQSLRVDTDLAVRFENAAGFHNAYLRNVADGGVYIETEQPLVLGDQFDLHIRVEQLGRSIDVRGEVVWVNSEPSSDAAVGRGVGVAFVDLQPDSKRAIKEVMHHALDRQVASR